MALCQIGPFAPRAAITRLLLPGLALCLAWIGRADAQSIGCVMQATAAPPRQVLRCHDGLTVEAEAGADFGLVDQNRDARPDAIDLRSRAVLVDAPATPGRRSFQVRTPQAIAAVRGTQWAVDVAGGRTSVFVVAGRVSVRRTRGGPGSVTLSPGEGVDVEVGTAPLVVRRWPAARASALLARFGR
ncbi:FecR family protein [Microvirga terrae]|uniref:FecR family protein n=1 Tax=Microvirga terrae TaxID=2740529 RepID=A0ABY5RXP0_9HYPH|nr:FecR family protein [Microvirga terrae]UVF21034.1 FecR family protein [Microvirga terrae]